MDLLYCDFCGVPKIGLEWDREKSLGDPDAFVEVSGPTTNPEIKNWCRGTCFGIMIKIALAEEYIEEELASGEFHARSKQECIDFINNVFSDLKKEVEKTLSRTYGKQDGRNS